MTKTETPVPVSIGAVKLFHARMCEALPCLGKAGNAKDLAGFCHFLQDEGFEIVEDEPQEEQHVTC